MMFITPTPPITRLIAAMASRAALTPPVIWRKHPDEQIRRHHGEVVGLVESQPRRSRRICVPCSIASSTHSGRAGTVAITHP